MFYMYNWWEPNLNKVDDVNDVFDVYVYKHNYKVTLSTNTINQQVGKTYTEQTATSYPTGMDVTWTTSGNGVARVDANGNIRALKPGVDTIRCALTEVPDVYAECRVIVYPQNVVYVGGLYYILSDTDATVTSIYGDEFTTYATNNVAQYCSGTINIPETIIYEGKTYTVSSIGNHAFSSQEDLQGLIVPNTVTTIGDNAASKSQKLKLVNVADNSKLVNIGNEAFKGCTSLARFTFEGSAPNMQSIDQSAFYGCSSLSRFVMPNSTHTIGNSAFRYCSSLTNITLSSSLNIINEYAFGECGFSKITLPESLANIQAGAFINNSHLQEITLPAILQGLGSAAFENCPALQSVKFLSTIETMTIGKNAFNLCPALSKVYITSMKSFAQTNFNNAKANPANTSHRICNIDGQEITDVILPEGTKYVNSNAFNGCTYIKSIVMPATMDHINDDIFMDCSALRHVYCAATDVPIFIGVNDPSTMNSVFQNATLHVPYSSLSDYHADSWWRRFGTIVGWNGEAEVYVTNIFLNNSTATLSPGSTQQLTATVIPSNASNKNVTWSSSNSSVATVSSNGKVTAVAIGEADITATAADGSGVKGVCHVTVVNAEVKVTGITLSQTAATLNPSNTLQLTATVSPSNASNKSVVWSSSNSNVATVSSNGKVTAVAIGEADITATAADGSGVKGVCHVTVVDAEVKVTGISLSQSTGTLNPGKTLQLTAYVNPSNASNKSVAWNSSNSSVATVSQNGLVTAVAAGEADITVTATDGSGVKNTCHVTVVGVKVTGITLSQSTATLNPNNTLQLTATVSPSNASNKNVTWSSSNESVATVYSDGKVTAMAIGEADITATAADGSGVKAVCHVTVKEKVISVQKIAFVEAPSTINIGKSLKLNVAFTPTNATNKTLSWTSGDTSVLTVDNEGNVKGIGKGTTTVVATTTDGSDLSIRCYITVKRPVTSIALSKSTATMSPGRTLQLSAIVNPYDASNKNVTWSSSNESVATVSSAGKVTAVAAGEADITATAADGTGIRAVCFVTVQNTNGIGQTTADDAKLTLNGHRLTVSGLADNEIVYIANTQGCTVYRGTERKFDLPDSGVYIVKFRGKSVKICVK